MTNPKDPEANSQETKRSRQSANVSLLSVDSSGRRDDSTAPEVPIATPETTPSHLEDSIRPHGSVTILEDRDEADRTTGAEEKQAREKDGTISTDLLSP